MKTAFVAFIVRCFGAGITFLMTVFVVRSLGAAEAGHFYLGMSLVAMLATIGNSGLEYSLLRFAGAAVAAGRWKTVRALSAVALRRSGLILVTLTIATGSFSVSLAIHMFREPSLERVFFFIAPSILFLGWSIIGGHALQSIPRTTQAVMVFSVITPLLVVLGLLLLAINSAAKMALLYVSATGVTAILGWAWFFQASRRNTENEVKFDAAELVRTGRVFWPGIVANQLLINNGYLVAGLWLVPEDVTIFAVAQRTAMLISFIVVAVNFVVAPRYAALHDRGDVEGLARMATFSVRLATLSSLPAVLLICLVPNRIMDIFEPGLNGGNVLVILAVGQLLTAMCGTLGVLMDMTGHERLHQHMIIGCTFTAVILIMILTPLYGVVGSALAVTIGLGLQNFLQAGAVHVLMGVRILGFAKRAGSE